MVSNNLINTLLIDSSHETRATLKGLFENDQQYKHLVCQDVFVANTFSDAENLLRKHKNIDVFFVSLGFSLDSIDKFMRLVRQDDKYKAKSFIMVCNASTDRDGAIIAQCVAMGVDAFLLYPCSVEQLREITKIAQTVKIKAHERMIDESLRLLINRLMTEVKIKVEQLYDHQHVTKYAKHLKDAAANLLLESKYAWDRYFVLLDEKLAESKPKITTVKVKLPRSKSLQAKVIQRQGSK